MTEPNCRTMEMAYREHVWSFLNEGNHECLSVGYATDIVKL